MKSVDIQVDTGAFAGAPDALLRKALRRVLLAEGRAGELSLALVDDEAMAALNLQYLGRAGTTDVLAFELGTEEAAVGDVYVCYDQAVRQASDLGIPLSEELARLAIHGALHALGYDHPDGAERLESPMFELQERLLREVLPKDG